MKLYLPFVASFPFFSTSGEAVIGENSPKGWDEVDDNCFLWSKVSMTWADAEQFCGEEGRGHLFSVETNINMTMHTG